MHPLLQRTLGGTHAALFYSGAKPAFALAVELAHNRPAEAGLADKIGESVLGMGPDMDRDSVEMKLPLRLEPRRTRVFQQFLFMLVWSGFILFWAIQFVPDFLHANGPLSLDEVTVEHLVLLVPLGMLLIGLYSLSRIVLQLLPGTDFVHVIVDRDGLRRRQFGTRQEIRWADIRRISIIRRKSGKSTKRVLLVEGHNDNPARDDERARYTAASFAFDLDAFLPSFCSEDKANQVGAWFNLLLQAARDSQFPGSVRIPGLLVPNTKSVGTKSVGEPQLGRSAETAPRRRNSVIER